MRDLTQGPITGHLLSMAAFIGIGLVVQTLYFLIDLWFVARLGADAVAGVNSAGNVFFLAMTASQLIAVGAMALIAQATGRKDQTDADLVSHQALSFGIVIGVGTLVAGYALAPTVARLIGADAATAQAGTAYLYGYLPALALMFPTIALTTALRATGVVQPTMYVQTGSLLINAILAPVLISGMGTGIALGPFGAGLASSIASLLSMIALVVMFGRVQKFLRIDFRRLRPNFSVWRRITDIGLPSALEFLIMFLTNIIIYVVIRDFGSHAQAGFGIGARIMQAIFLPAMAVAFAAAPIAGQNFGAKSFDRVRLTFRQAALIGSAIMAALTLLCQLAPDFMLAPFASDAVTLGVAIGYLKVVSWNFVAIGINFACGGMFQALGDTRPSLIASASRIVTFAVPAIWLAQSADLRLEHIWWLSLVSATTQALISFVLMRRMFVRKLGPTLAHATGTT
ncbi:MAG: MATE family efflux transporter [Alphaproteobacteria bacterium]|nr:MATE family efflux transporter [Alphaproteobacteria bacterium]